MTSLFLKQLSVGTMANFAYFVGDETTREVLLIDPSWDAPALLTVIEGEKLKLRYVVATHSHYDHVNALVGILEEHDAPVLFHKRESEILKEPFPSGEAVEDGHRLKLGDVEFEFLHTPGHTPGSLCILAAGCLFTGDTLFVGGVGRTDFRGSNPRDMAASLKKLAALPGETRVFPGHDYGSRPVSTIDFEIRHNPYLNGGHK